MGLFVDGRVSLGVAALGKGLQRFGAVLSGDLPATADFGAVCGVFGVLLWGALPAGVPERDATEGDSGEGGGLGWVGVDSGVEGVLHFADAREDLSDRCAAVVCPVCGVVGPCRVFSEFVEEGIAESARAAGDHRAVDVAVGVG